MAIVFINGKFLAEKDAKVSVFDRGFLFADGIYEVIPIFSGRMLCVDSHLQRLEESLNAIHIQMPYTPAEFKNIFHELLIQNQKSNATVNIYLQITRGTDSGRNHSISTTLKPTVVAFCTPAKAFKQESFKQGFHAITLEDSRRRDCHIKMISLLPNILLYEQARQAGALDAILTRNGEVTEGTSSNVFIVKNNEILTPAESNQILSGVTRQLVINLARENQIPCHENCIPLQLLKTADEIWLTGSAKEICPVTTLDNQPVGNGQVGPMWHRIMDYYETEKNIDRTEEKAEVQHKAEKGPLTKLEPSHD